MNKDTIIEKKRGQNLRGIFVIKQEVYLVGNKQSFRNEGVKREYRVSIGRE